MLKDLEQHGHDVYEFCYFYDIEKPVHWNENSIYIDSDDMTVLAPYINQVILDFSYYGPQKVECSDWEKIKRICMVDHFEDMDFFLKIDDWLMQSKIGDAFFWILGV